MFKSIRLRLALSFAGIALLAALALGGVLLAILQGYYSNLELNYLTGNARVVSETVAKMMATHSQPDELQSQIENLAFLTQTRIQVFGADKQLTYDSGSPQDVKVNLGATKQLFAVGGATAPGDSLSIIAVSPQGNTRFFSQQASTSPMPAAPDNLTAIASPKGTIIYRSIRVAGSPFGFDLSTEAAQEGARSGLTVGMPIGDAQNTAGTGFIQLSEGPAYGSAVLQSVALGWLLASAIAVLLAAAVGWYVSSRISAPVLALTGVTSRMAQGDLSGRAGIDSRDELGQLARSFNEMADQVETTILTLRSFVSDAAHEINTPLTALTTNLELAINEQDPIQKEEFLTRALKQNERLGHLANELLDLSRIEAQQLAREPDVFDVRELAAQIGERFASRAEQAGREFDLVLPAGGILLRGNSQQIRRAVDNLLENALKFTALGGLIRMELKADAEEAVLTVADTGIGILPADLGQLFQRFHRGLNASAYAGNGLGLAIVKAIASAHRGLVQVQSAGEGQGSSFSIRLPREASAR